MKIEIENPCHENWDTMQPNEKGAFCLSCSKNVVDFSKKSLGEIKAFFADLAGSEKVCGRFKEQQLQALSFEDFFSRFRSWRLLHKIALVVFFVFGLSLFGCAQSSKNNTPHLLGEISIPPADTIKKPVKKDSTSTHIKGKTKIVREPSKREEPMIMGKPSIPRDEDRKRQAK